MQFQLGARTKSTSTPVESQYEKISYMGSSNVLSHVANMLTQFGDDDDDDAMPASSVFLFPVSVN